MLTLFKEYADQTKGNKTQVHVDCRPEEAFGHLLYTHINAYVNRDIIEHNDDFNERTNSLLYKNIPLSLYSRKGCERVAVGYV